MNLRRPDLAALVFCGLVVVAVSVLAGLQVDVPEFLPTIGLVVAGAAGGVALNTTPNLAPAEPAPAFIPEAPAPAPSSLARVPAPRTDDEPVPYATHAP